MNQPIDSELRSNEQEQCRIAMPSLLYISMSFIVISVINLIEGKNFMKQHIRHCLLYEFWKESATTGAMKNVCEMYFGYSEVKAETCQL